MMDRVQFFPPNDIMCGHWHNRLMDLVKNYDSEEQDYEVNDIIEFYNITLYSDNNLFLTSWSEDEVKKIKDTCKHYRCTVSRYFGSISCDNIINIYKSTDQEYKEHFWNIFEKFEIFKKYTEEVFFRFIEYCKPVLWYLLQQKKIVAYFDKPIKDYIMSKPENIELVLDKYERHDCRREIHLPKSLTNEDKEALIIRYINGSNPNPNYLELISNIQNNKDRIIIKDKTRLLAKRKDREIRNEFFNRNNSLEFNISVSFTDQDEVVIQNFDGTSVKLSYDLKWIENNLDYPTLFNNFLYLFNYADRQMCITFVNKVSEQDVLERSLMHSKTSYNTGFTYQQKNIISDLQLFSYINLLREQGISIESLIKWFFEQHLLNEFGIENFLIEIPSDESKLLEKCRLILPEMEKVLKQYNLFVEENEIDHNLLQISSDQLLFSNCKSKLQKKYIYANHDNDELRSLFHYFFSDQSRLAYIKRIPKSYRNFFELLKNENVRLEDYSKHRIIGLNWLIDKHYITVINGIIQINNLLEVLILRDIYINDVVSYWRYPLIFRKEMDRLLDKDFLLSESSLFSKSEQDYFNYLLNKKTFNNSLDLRNKYIHGTQPSSPEDDRIHQHNYFTFLKLLIIIVIKINDDLCLSNP